MTEALVLLLLFVVAVVFYVPLVVMIGRFWIDFSKSIVGMIIRFVEQAKSKQSA